MKITQPMYVTFVRDSGTDENGNPVRTVLASNGSGDKIELYNAFPWKVGDKLKVTVEGKSDPLHIPFSEDG